MTCQMNYREKRNIPIISQAMLQDVRNSKGLRLVRQYFMKQFLGIILNYFQKQNFVWKFKCKKIALLLVFMQLCSMQKFSKHFSSFQLVFITFYKKQFKTPKTCSKKQLIFRTNSEKKKSFMSKICHMCFVTQKTFYIFKNSYQTDS